MTSSIDLGRDLGRDPGRDPTDVLRAHAEAIDARDWPGLRAVLADGFVCRLVRTGERHGPDDYVASHRDHPGRWRFELDDVLAGGARVAGRARVSDGPQVFHVALFATVAGGLVTALDEVWTEDRTPTAAPPGGETA